MSDPIVIANGWLCVSPTRRIRLSEIVGYRWGDWGYIELDVKGIAPVSLWLGVSDGTIDLRQKAMEILDLALADGN